MPSDGAILDIWPDISGHGRDFTRQYGVSSDGPFYRTNALNGHPGIQWVAQGNYYLGPDLSSVLPSAATIVIVWNNIGGSPFSGGQCMLFQDTLTFRDGWWLYGGDGNGYFTAFRSPRAGGFPASMPGDTTNSHWIRLKSSSGLYQATIDGTYKGDAGGSYAIGTQPNLCGVSTNSGTRFTGYIFEVIIIDHVTSSGEDTNLDAYINYKFFGGASTSWTPASLTGLAVWLAPESWTQRRIGQETVEADVVPAAVQRRIGQEVVEADVVPQAVRRTLADLIIEVDYVFIPATNLTGIGAIGSSEGFGIPAVIGEDFGGSVNLSSGGSIDVFGYPVIVIPKVGEPPRKTQRRRRVPGEMWAADVLVSQPAALSSEQPVLVDFGGIGWTAGGLAHKITESDREEMFTPSYSPPDHLADQGHS